MRKIKVICIAAIAILLIGIAVILWVNTHPKGIVLTNGAVPNEETAIKIAEAVWYPIYGERIYSKQPFVVEYISLDKCWYVQGSLPENMVGGVPEIKIRKSDGKILYVSHGK